MYQTPPWKVMHTLIFVFSKKKNTLIFVVASEISTFWEMQRLLRREVFEGRKGISA